MKKNITPSIYVRLELPFALLMLCTISWISNHLDWDIRISASFYSLTSGWEMADWYPVVWLYHYGTLPAVFTTIFLGGGALLSFKFTRFRPVRGLGFFVVVFLLLGPGLMVNSIFKEHFGRPRPNQTVIFGGDLPFEPCGSPGVPHVGKSFPSGHASMGFFWLALYVFYRGNNRKAAVAFFVLGLIHGGLMGVGRIAQGKHYFTDIIWAGGMDYLVAYAIRAAMLAWTVVPSRKEQLTGETAVLITSKSETIKDIML
jgi:membrane-associated PAP2 superfamily phosphatase